jgi:glycine C-acetyltransferase
MGGASGGYVSGRREIVELLRQRARPYLFSNSVAPPIAAAGLKAIELVEGSPDLRDRLWANTARFRSAMGEAGFAIVEGTHPIVPVMLGDAAVSARFAELLWARGVYAVSFSFPVVPRDTARIRTQLSAAHTFEDIDFAVAQFVSVRDELSL